MTGKNKGVISFIREKHSNIFLSGCPCHLIHIAAEKSAKGLPVAVDELLIDVYYYLDKSTKRNKALSEFQELCGTGTRKILKHCSTRWLSLSACVNRLIEQWEPLAKYFRSEVQSSVSSIMKSVSKRISKPSLKSTPHKPKTTSTNQPSNSKHPASSSESVSVTSTSKSSSSSKKTKSSHNSESRPQRVKRLLTVPQTKLYCVFLRYAQKDFDKANTLLQTEQPCIHFLLRELHGLVKSQLVKLLKPCVLDGFSFANVKDIDYKSKSNQRQNKELMIGSDARDYLEQCKDLSEVDQESFFKSVKKYYCAGLDYMIGKFPLDDSLLKHAEVLDLSLRKDVSFKSVDYFVKKFPCLLPLAKGKSSNEIRDDLELEFANYQFEELESIEKTDRVDLQWHEISNIKVSGITKYPTLSKVMQGVCVIPHSNADCERVFSIVRKNKTDFRSNMSVETLQALLIEKINSGIPCHKRKFSADFLNKAKKATAESLSQP